MGLVPAKGMATTVIIDPDFVWAVPDHWTLEDAATVPVVYSTVNKSKPQVNIGSKHRNMTF